MRVRRHRSGYGSHFDDVDRRAHDGVSNTGLYKYSQEKSYSLSVNNFPEVMRVSEVCMLLIVVNTLLTK